MIPSTLLYRGESEKSSPESLSGMSAVLAFRKLFNTILFLLLHLVMVIGLPAEVCPSEQFTLSAGLIKEVRKKYGEQAERRLISWQNLIRENRSATEMVKLEKVNSFFNSIHYVDDIVHWKKKDYWATPVEMLATNGGDCEDYSFAKYFTLKVLGVDEKKLNITYVKALDYNMAHMVLTYYSTPKAEPLVLDNLINEIRPASQRKDLVPVYSFNTAGLWLAQTRGQGQRVGGSERLKLWRDLLKRIPKELQ